MSCSITSFINTVQPAALPVVPLHACMHPAQFGVTHAICAASCGGWCCRYVDPLSDDLWGEFDAMIAEG